LREVWKGSHRRTSGQGDGKGISFGGGLVGTKFKYIPIIECKQEAYTKIAEEKIGSARAAEGKAGQVAQ